MSRDLLRCGTIHLVKEPNLPGKLCLMVVSSSGTENKVSDVLSYMLCNTLSSAFSQCALTTFCNFSEDAKSSNRLRPLLRLLLWWSSMSENQSSYKFCSFLWSFIYTLNMLFLRSAKVKLIRDHKEKVDLSQMPLTYLPILSYCVFSLILRYKYPEKPGVIQFSGLQILKLT